MEKITVLSLFSGCGGMDLGFEGGFDAMSTSINTYMHPSWVEEDYKNGWVRLAKTGFKTIFANDISDKTKKLWEKNFKKYGHADDEYHVGSIVDLVRAAESGSFEFPKADIVTGGFPCTDFSLSGKRKGFKSEKDHNGNLMTEGCPTEESRGMLYYWMHKVISIVKPKIFVAENVGAIRSLPEIFNTISNDFSSLGYHVEIQTLACVNYGIPQTRVRVIFIGVRNDINYSDNLHPVETHGECLFENKQPIVSSGKAFKGLLEPNESVDPSQSSLSKANFYGKHLQGQNEVICSKPGPTIRAEHHGNIEFRRLSKAHGGKNFNEIAMGLPERRLTVRECARLQTFPDDFEFVGGIGKNRVGAPDAYRAIGNAVPPILAYHVAMRLKEVIQWETL
jgi:DNA (cytosine-5)-methyltransferase 1